MKFLKRNMFWIAVVLLAAPETFAGATAGVPILTSQKKTSYRPGEQIVFTTAVTDAPAKELRAHAKLPADSGLKIIAEPAVSGPGTVSLMTKLEFKSLGALPSLIILVQKRDSSNSRWENFLSTTYSNLTGLKE